MKKMIKSAALALALLTLLLFAGCCVPGKPGSTPGSTPEPQPVHSPEPGSARSLFAELDWQIFADSVTENALTFRLSVGSPEALGLEYPENTWGDFSKQANDLGIAKCNEYLTKLNQIDREQLSYQEKFSYDVIRQYLDGCVAMGDYYYYYEPLTSLNGAHSSLPMNLMFFPIQNEGDLDSYLELLSDTPRYIGQILEFEREKSEKGLFMTEAACETVIEQCDDFIDSGEGCFLIATFNDALADVEGLSPEQIAAYQERNAKLVTVDLIDAYKELRDGLVKLKSTGTRDRGLSTYGDTDKRYFELLVKEAASSDITIEEAYNMLYTRIIKEFTSLAGVMAADPSLAGRYGQTELSLGSVEENMAYLKELIADAYPSIPEHNITYTDVPEELEEQFSPAAYLIPPVDSAVDNLIILNGKSVGESTDLISTLAHEGYPGHMYQYIYQRNLPGLSYTQRSLGLTAYYEGWSTHSESHFAANNDKFDNRYCIMMFTDTMISGILLPAAVSIGVNGKGWSVEDVEEFLYSLGLDGNGLDSVYYDYAITDPDYFLEYAMGYTQLENLIDGVKKDAKDMEPKEFFKFYLDLGPGYYNLIEDRVNDWMAAR